MTVATNAKMSGAAFTSQMVRLKTGAGDKNGAGLPAESESQQNPKFAPNTGAYRAAKMVP
jgi:hypothetical protein